MCFVLMLNEQGGNENFYSVLSPDIGVCLRNVHAGFNNVLGEQCIVHFLMEKCPHVTVMSLLLPL